LESSVLYKRLALGDKSYSLLANHGVVVVADSVDQALTRCISLEWRCKQAWHVEAIGGGGPISQYGERVMLETFNGRSAGVIPHLFEWAARREIRHDPSVLD
jgi:ribulose-5-phosphate 4-epimerase/fuculose-1-phosphate aldolase